MKRLLSLFCALTIHLNIFGHYQLINEPIDVIIPAIEKDLSTLEYCIQGIKNNCLGLRRVIVVSPNRLTHNAEWFPESDYPFSKDDVARYLNRLNPIKTAQYINKPNKRIGWYYQQLLKLYAPSVIPGISSNVLIVDADTVFFRPITFLNEKNGGNYAVGQQHHKPYFEHSNKLLPGLKFFLKDKSGICNHMLFQKAVIDDLFFQVESIHKVEFWKAFCLCVNPGYLSCSGASEYEIYFNFAFSRTNQVKIRHLRWMNSSDLHLMEQHSQTGYDYVSYHAWLRKYPE